MRVYGDRDQNLENIEVSPDGKEFLVHIEGQEKPLFMDAERFKMFTGAVNPKILESISQRSNEEEAPPQVQKSKIPELPPYMSFMGTPMMANPSPCIKAALFPFIGTGTGDLPAAKCACQRRRPRPTTWPGKKRAGNTKGNGRIWQADR